MRGRVLNTAVMYVLLHIALLVCLFFMGFDFTFPADHEYHRADRDVFYITGGWWSAFSTLGCIVYYFTAERG